jgi:predicted Rossmann fold flavoprotein
MSKVIVIGGGAGGLLAAGRAAECGASVVLLEKNGVLGRKLRLTGKGRGNITNTADLNDFIAAFGPNGKFLYGAFSRFSNQDLIELLERLGVPTKIERGGRVFPKSDRAADVAAAFEAWLLESKVDIRLGVRAQGLALDTERRGEGVMGRGGESGPEGHQSSTINHQPSAISGVRVFGGVMAADAVVLATGGITYPRTGSTGDGYQWAAEVGHTVIPPSPSLSALEVQEPWVSQLQGLSLRNVTATLFSNGKKIGKEFGGFDKLTTGEMVFTHFGVSGPIILTLSKTYTKLEDKGDISLSINLKPAVKREELDERLIRDFAQTRQFKNYLPELLPRTLIPVFIQLSGIPADTPVNRITALQRRRIIELLTDFRLTITGARSADEAIVTAGGVSLKEIDPRTMESRLIKGLYFAGEVMDIDAVTGGYNLQTAFSTGWVAGESAAKRNSESDGE